MALSQPSVLIVDRSSENREVLRTILQRDGIHIIEADSGGTGLDLAKCWHPKVMVLDADTMDLNDPTVCGGYDEEIRQENTSVVLLGRIRESRSPLLTSEVLPKPYHYAPLIRRIEELLQHADPQATD